MAPSARPNGILYAVPVESGSVPVFAIDTRSCSVPEMRGRPVHPVPGRSAVGTSDRSTARSWLEPVRPDEGAAA